MSKKSLLSYTTTVAIIVFSTHFNAYAKSLSAGKGEKKIAPPQESYENIYAFDGGKIYGKDLKITGLPIQEGSIIKDISSAKAENPGSMIELEGDTTIKNVAIGLWAKESSTIKMTDGSIHVKKLNIHTPIGIEAKSNGAIALYNVKIKASDQDQSTKTINENEIGDGIGASLKNGGTLKMIGGSIKANHLGVVLEESNSDKNELKNVTIDLMDLTNTATESIGISAIKTSKIVLKNVTVKHARTSIYASDNSQITISGGSIQGNHTGINVEKESVITLKDNVEVLSNGHGLSANGLQSKITMIGGTLNTAGLQPAVLAGSGGQINLTDVVVHTDDNGTQMQEPEMKDALLTTQGLQAQYMQSKITMIRGSITTTGLNPAVLAGSGGKIDLTDVSMNAYNVGLQAQGEQSKIVMKKGALTTTGLQPAVLAGSGGQIHLADVSIKTNDIGLQAQNDQSKIIMKRGTLIKTGPRSAIFATRGGQISLLSAQVHTDSVGLAIRGKQSKITLKDSKVLANIVLVGRPNEGDPGEANVIADHSLLEGGARNSKKNPTQTIFSLINGTTWYLKASTKNDIRQQADLIKKLHSEVFMLNLNNSTIVFKKPREDHYQTLHISSQTPNIINDNTTNKTVYTATGDARIYFNTAWSNGLPKDQQKTDRLLVHGDVSGSTTIHFSNLSKSEPSNIENTIPLNMRGLSLVQVSGKANENAFKLANGYATIGGLPYKYTLNAYGPTSSHGKASLEQSLVGEEQNFWDFRLQSATLDREAKIKALVPQVASYLVMPNALFSAGFTDVNNQNALLNDMQTALFAPESHKKSGIFLSSYGNKITLSSNRNPLQYGYGADVQHTALQAGIALAGLEKQNITTSLGLLGTYGKLAFTPKDIEGAEKSTIDKWSFTVYGNIQHNNGIYLDTLFSYGTLKGNITTAFIGNTTQLNKTKTLSASATVSQKLGTGVEGLVFEPQAQFVYQRLMFEKLSDIDGFEVNMGKPHQWLLRFGGCLIQTVMPVERNHAVSFYGKVNFIKAFSDNGTIKIGDTFHRDSMGSSLEGGFGVNAQLSQNIALHAGVNYQHKLQKAGISAINFSGGIHYGF
ncbi:autotransporter outer membrane beta-barrel domain-containing protein [Bartonella quintana]|uniref:autotransporter family protein n=1 Tax=Bartonella quintana TaxID=803 RepID=UPI000DA28C91|nr:autotransporter outer membrane beta-barrel domain-containing protein [Bartonella quintana]SQF96371.1 Type V secretory pathway, adhesin AidA [Bartonella quintana]